MLSRNDIAYVIRNPKANVVYPGFPFSVSLLLGLPVPTILAFPGHQSASARKNFQILKHVKRPTGQNSVLSRDVTSGVESLLTFSQAT